MDSGLTVRLAPPYWRSTEMTAEPLVFTAGVDDTATARLMGRLFGVRDIGLGVLAFYARSLRDAGGAGSLAAAGGAVPPAAGRVLASVARRGAAAADGLLQRER